MFAIGLDIGTSSLKTLVLDEKQQVLFEKSYSYQYQELKDGYRQIDPIVWTDVVMTGLKEAMDVIGDKGEVVIGVTGQMHTTVFLNKNGKPVYPAILWNDLRTVYIVPTLKKELSTYPETKYISKIISPGSPAANTIWFHNEYPECFKTVRHILTPYDYIVYFLTGRYSQDYCDASTSSMYDIQSKTWSSIMMQKCKVTESILGKVMPSCQIVGKVLPEICDELKCKSAPEVIVGTGDNPANAVSLQLIEHKDPVISLGTSGVVLIAKEDGDFEGKGKNVLFSKDGKHIVNIVQGTVRSAGGAQRWWIENVIQTADFGVDQNNILEEDLGNNSVFFFPHITGDKLVYQDLDIRGAFIGLSASSQRKDMTQAVMEGVGYALKEVMENMGLKSWPQKVRINGGGTQSKIWMQILASILNVQLEVVSGKASPCFGICLLALQAKMDLKCSHEESQGSFYPDIKLVDRYKEGYRKYKKIYKALKEIA